MNKLNSAKNAEYFGEFFHSTKTIDTVYAQRSNLTTSLHQEEIEFINLVEDRRQSFKVKAAEQKSHIPPWAFREGDYKKGETYAAMTLDWHHRGKLCLLRQKTDYNFISLVLVNVTIFF